MEKFTGWPKKRYSPVSSVSSDTDVDVPLEELSTTGLVTGKTKQKQPKIIIGYSKKKVFLFTFLNFVIWIATVVFLGRFYITHYGMNTLLKQTSMPSRVFDEVNIDMPVKRVNGSFFLPSSDKMGLGRMEPSPYVDALFQHYEIIRFVALDRQQLLDVNVDPEKAVKLNDDYWHLGEEKYLGQLDVYHKIHCYNVLRTAAFKDYFGPPNPTSEISWVHLRHCSDMILQDLMCHADADFLTFQWTETQLNPFPNFNIDRKCRNFDAMDAWLDKNALDLEKYILWPRPNDAIVVDIEEGYWPLFMGVEKRPEGYKDGWTAEEVEKRKMDALMEFREEQKKTEAILKAGPVKSGRENIVRPVMPLEGGRVVPPQADDHSQHHH